MQTLNEIRENLKTCQKCSLWQTRTNIVFGRGNEHARIMLIGEAPGKNEDLQGEPFVGAAGHTLENILQTAGLSLDDIYIANVLKCRPPNNRNPQTDEIAACTPYLDEQIDAINPDVIVCLGNFAARHILGDFVKDETMTSMRGHIWQINGRYVVPVFHPAATIYDRSKLPVLTHDLCAIKKLVERASQKRSARWRP